MKTLSLLQPWASLVASGAKRIETRSWATNYRGPLLIHASKSRAELEFDSSCDLLRHAQLQISDLPFGAIIAKCRLINCVPTQGFDAGRIDISNADFEQSPEYEMGNFEPGRWAWILSDVERFTEPIPARGSLGLWEFEL